MYTYQLEGQQDVSYELINAWINKINDYTRHYRQYDSIIQQELIKIQQRK